MKSVLVPLVKIMEIITPKNCVQAIASIQDEHSQCYAKKELKP